MNAQMSTRRRRAVATAGAAVLLLTIGAILLAPTDTPTARTAAADGQRSPVPASPSEQPAASALSTTAEETSTAETPAAPVLTRLAATLTDASADTAAGAYSYVEMRSWVRASMIPPDGGLPPVEVQRVQQWQDGKGNGRRLAVDETGVCRSIEPDATWSGQPVDIRAVPAKTDRASVRKLLLAGAGPGADKPVDIMAGVAGLAEDQALRRPVRATVLRLLAELPGLLVREHARNRTGQVGLHVILPYTEAFGTPARYVLAFDESAGVLQAAWIVLTGPSTGTDPLLGPVGIALHRAYLETGYRQYLVSTFTISTTTPAGGCPSPSSSPSTRR